MQGAFDVSNIYAEEKGFGKPVLMIHGFAVDHHALKGCMEPVFQDVAGYRRIYFDLPGMGRTPAMPEVRSADAFLELVLRFVERAVPRGELSIVASSYGAYLALGVLARMGARVSRAALICPVVVAGKERRTLPRHEVLESEELDLSALSREEAQAFREVSVLQTKDAFGRYAAEILPGLRAGDAGYLNGIETGAYGYSFDCLDAVRAYGGPLLVLTGKQDAVVGFEDQRVLRKILARVEVVEVDRAGHNLPIEQPEEFSAHMRRFLIEG